ncbi:MAG: hypothetical protein IIY82_00470 [Firmicutes bacterium]|nr:hypothetical protein [Bacillota bacterium]
MCDKGGPALTEEELRDLLEIEEGGNLEYFENYAELMETGEEIAAETMARVLAGVDLYDFAELTENWFDEMMNNLPDEAMAVYDILEAEKRYLMSLAQTAAGAPDGRIPDPEESAEARGKLWNELERFREWFTLSQNCEVTDHGRGRRYPATIADAIAEYRFAKLDHRNVDVDLSGAEDFIVEEYIRTLGELL